MPSAATHSRRKPRQFMPLTCTCSNSPERSRNRLPRYAGFASA
jgi:hypothetical protein